MSCSERHPARSRRKGQRTPRKEIYIDEFWIDDIEVTQHSYDECVAAKVCLKINLEPLSCDKAAYGRDPRWSSECIHLGKLDPVRSHAQYRSPIGAYNRVGNAWELVQDDYVADRGPYLERSDRRARSHAAPQAAMQGGMAAVTPVLFDACLARQVERKVMRQQASFPNTSSTSSRHRLPG